MRGRSAIRAARRQRMADGFHVVGPLNDGNKWLLLCPVCDDDRVTGLEGADVQCTVDWLRGQQISGHGKLSHLSCVCFQTDPLEGVAGATDAQRRFFYYSAIARLLGATGQRVDLPACVKEEISSLHGQSVVGFVGN